MDILIRRRVQQTFGIILVRLTTATTILSNFRLNLQNLKCE